MEKMHVTILDKWDGDTTTMQFRDYIKAAYILMHGFGVDKKSAMQHVNAVRKSVYKLTRTFEHSCYRITIEVKSGE